MIDGRETYLKWRGQHPWSDWVKPTLFQNPPSIESIANVPLETEQLIRNLRNADLHGQSEGGVSCLIVDLPSDDSVIFGIALADEGFFPVPVYNGVSAPLGVEALIDNFRLQARLFELASSLRWPISGGPAFLLDARRLTGKSSVGVFDNRWITMPQDYPSGHKMREMNVNRCYVVSATTSIQTDMIQVLYRWQEAGIEIYEWKGHSFSSIKIKLPGFFERYFHRAKSLIGLAPSEVTGFGAIVGGASGG